MSQNNSFAPPPSQDPNQPAQQPNPGQPQYGQPASGQPGSQQPQWPAANPAPQGYGYGPPPQQKTNTLGIVALILAFLIAPIGLILGIVSWVQSKKAGTSAVLGIIATIVGAVATAILVIVSISLFAVASDAIGGVAECQANGNTGTVTVAGQQIPCSELMESQNLDDN